MIRINWSKLKDELWTDVALAVDDDVTDAQLDLIVEAVVATIETHVDNQQLMDAIVGRKG